MMDGLLSFLSFAGRAKRREYIGFTLLIFLLLIIGFAIYEGMSAAFGADIPTAVTVICVIVGMLVFVYVMVASIGVTVRRLHDMDLSGWFYFLVVALNYVPYVGWLAGLVWLCFVPGTKGANRFGPDPRDPQNTALLRVFEGEAVDPTPVANRMQPRLD